MTDIAFNIHDGEQTTVLGVAELEKYAKVFHLDLHAKGRYSWFFVLSILIYQRLHGINPFRVVDAIRDLEASRRSTRTKPAAQFLREPLRGLWHKHFFSARFLAHNIQNHLARGKLERIVAEVCDPAVSPVITEEMIKQLAHRVTVEAIEDRAQGSRLTGEWIVFAKHEGQNYYLCLAGHRTGDDVIYNNIKAACWPQFPFLAEQPC